MAKKIKSVSGHYAKYLLPTFEQSENTSATRQMIFFFNVFLGTYRTEAGISPSRKNKGREKTYF